MGTLLSIWRGSKLVTIGASSRGVREEGLGGKKLHGAGKRIGAEKKADP